LKVFEYFIFTMSITLKILCFPEFGRALLGVGDEGIALLDTPVAEALVRALQESLPIASMQRASIYVDQVQVAWGFIPGVHDHLWGSDGRDLAVWERWLETTAVETLWELWDQVAMAGADDGPRWETEAATEAEADPLLVARRAREALAAQPEVLFQVALLRGEMAPVLTQGGWALSQENFGKVRDEVVRLLGTPDEFRQLAYEMLQDSLPHLELEPVKAQEPAGWWRCLWRLA
jgi:hypothetical protein